VAEVSGISAEEDIAEPYMNLMNHLDTFQFSQKMATDRGLWVAENLSRSNEHMREGDQAE